MKLSNYEQQIKLLSSQNDDEKSYSTHILNEKINEINTLSSQVSSLQGQLENQQTLSNDTINTLTIQMEQLRNDLLIQKINYDSQLLHTTKEYESTIHTLQSTIETLQDTVDVQMKNNTNLNTTLEYTKQLLDEKNNTYILQLENMNLKLSTLQNELDTLKKDGNTILLNKENEWNNEKQSLLSTIENLTNQLKELNDIRINLENNIKSHICHTERKIETDTLSKLNSGNIQLFRETSLISQSIKMENFILTSIQQIELTAYSKYFNQVLDNDQDLSYLLPINIHSTELLSKIKDGILLAKFINTIIPNTIDIRTLNIQRPLKSKSILQNLNLCINAAKSIGCTMKIEDESNNDTNNTDDTSNIHSNNVDIGYAQQQLLQCTQPSLILDFIYQLIKLKLLSTISLRSYPQLSILTTLKGSHNSSYLKSLTIDQLTLLSPEQLLQRWYNYHILNYNNSLTCYESIHTISNFGNDMNNGINYNIILDTIEQYKLSHNMNTNTNNTPPTFHRRTSSQLTNYITNIFLRLHSMSIIHFHDETIVSSGHERLNLLLCAILFNDCIAIDTPTQQVVEFPTSLELDEDRDATACRMWMNGAGISGFHIHHVYHDVRDGIILLKLLDWLESQTVNWKQVEMNANNKFKSISNCNYFLSLCNDCAPFHFSLVGIGGSDIYDGNKKFILTII